MAKCHNDPLVNSFACFRETILLMINVNFISEVLQQKL